MQPGIPESGLTMENASPALENETQQLLNATIFMVDDEPITMDVVQGFLEEAGYHNFVLVENSEQAMASLEKHRPDLLLLDLIMPQVSGFDILKAVRAHPKLKHLPIIVLTSSSDYRDKLAALDLGATDFLAKPVDPSELQLRVRNTLAAKAYMDQLAFYDPLTKLPNRHLFMEQLEWSLNAAKRSGEKLALLSIELDQFKKISDALGLFAGDDILQQQAWRIREIVRVIDLLGHLDTEDQAPLNLFHFDGGTFALLLNRIRSERNAALAAQRILEAVKAPVVVENTEIYMTASIGIATYPIEDGGSAYLLQSASAAKDYAKNGGGNTFQFSSRQINMQCQQRLSLEARLRRALDRNEFVLHYQPKLDVQTNVVTGVEALLRWHIKDLGWIEPEEFISMAEETGLVIPIGEWVMSHACKQLSEWQRAGKAPIGMAVNLSAVQFENGEMHAIFKRIIQNSGVDPRLLTLELTESILLGEIEKKIESMNHLKDLGLQLSIDDFGTGYSSLRYLRRLPLDELKIDRSFFVNLFEDTKGRSLLSSLISMARNLNLRTVAEGVETEQQLFFLQKERCDQYQGLFFKPPLEGAEILALLS
ncbi:MAG: EAL domain-containing protein [Desulfobacterota bacterium]|jgi:diguanylate cyclase (GGDEF)-like protein|nr:EAL domain-containing protein [Thermodesulfobacteriota bacterium]